MKDEPLSSSSEHGSKWSWASLPSNILEKGLVKENDAIVPRIDKTLEDEFLLVLRQCNIYPEATDNIPHMQTISETDSRLDEESLHSAILDSTHIRGSSESSMVLAENPTLIQDPGFANSRCDCFPIKLRGWNPKRKFKSKQTPDDIRSPLLNPNAIHDRRSLNNMFLNIKDGWSNDEQEHIIHPVNQEGEKEYR